VTRVATPETEERLLTVARAGWEANLRHGVRVDSHTLTPDWGGERLDVGYAIEVLHPLAVGARAGDQPQDIKVGILSD
jgi:hypothetical protein